MKKLIAALIISLALAFGCAGVQPVDPINHQLELVVSSDNPVAVEVVDGVFLPPMGQGGSPFLELSQESSINENTPDGTCFMKLFSGISVSDYTRMHNDFNFLLNMTEVRHVELLINSPGGDAFAGLALSDLINRFQKKGLTVEAHGAGIVASAAVPVFAVSSPRYASKGTIFMVHEAALWKWPGRESASDIRSQNELMIKLQNKYLGYLVDNSDLTMEDWQAKEKATTWFSTAEAIEWGLVDNLE